MGGKHYGLVFEPNVTTLKCLFTIVTNNSRQPSTSIATLLYHKFIMSVITYLLFGIHSEPQLLSLNMSPTCSMGLITSATAMLIMSSACLESWITSKAL